MSELISVIIPVYNVREYLPQCLDSVIRQTYQNIEIIVVDDGSTDGSLLICDEFAGKDPRIRVIRAAHGGISAARNIGIENANGVYLTFLDSVCEQSVSRSGLEQNVPGGGVCRDSICGGTHLRRCGPDVENYEKSG